MIVFEVTRVHCFLCRPSDNDPGWNRERHEKAAMPIVMRYQDSRAGAWPADHGALSLPEARRRSLGAKAVEESHARATSGRARAWGLENAFSSRATCPALAPQRSQASESQKNQASRSHRGSQLVVFLYLTGPVNQLVPVRCLSHAVTAAAHRV